METYFGNLERKKNTEPLETFEKFPSTVRYQRL